jgi:hypothetical protein
MDHLRATPSANHAIVVGRCSGQTATERANGIEMCDLAGGEAPAARPLPGAVLSARGAQSCVAKTAGLDGARVDRGLLDGRVGVQQVREVVRTAAVMGGDEAGIKRSPDGAGALQAMALQPAPEETSQQTADSIHSLQSSASQAPGCVGSRTW